MLPLEVRHIVTNETLVGPVVTRDADVDKQVEEDDLEVAQRNLGHLGAVLEFQLNASESSSDKVMSVTQKLEICIN